MTTAMVAVEFAVRRAWGLDPQRPALRPTLGEIIDLDPYARLVAEFRRYEGFVDRTDWNYSTCWTYQINVGPGDDLEVQLSAIGPFAALWRRTAAPDDRVITRVTAAAAPESARAKAVRGLIEHAGFRILSEDELAQSVALDLKVIEPDIEDFDNHYRDGYVSLYQALFEYMFGQPADEAR